MGKFDDIDELEQDKDQEKKGTKINIDDVEKRINKLIEEEERILENYEELESEINEFKKYRKEIELILKEVRTKNDLMQSNLNNISKHKEEIELEISKGKSYFKKAINSYKKTFNLYVLLSVLNVIFVVGFNLYMKV